MPPTRTRPLSKLKNYKSHRRVQAPKTLRLYHCTSPEDTLFRVSDLAGHVTPSFAADKGERH